MDGERLTVPVVERKSHRLDLLEHDAEPGVGIGKDADDFSLTVGWRVSLGLPVIPEGEPPAERIDDGEIRFGGGEAREVLLGMGRRPDQRYDGVEQLAAEGFGVVSELEGGKLRMLLHG